MLRRLRLVRVLSLGFALSFGVFPPPARAVGTWALSLMHVLRNTAGDFNVRPPVIGNGGIAYWIEQPPGASNISLLANPGGVLVTQTRASGQAGDFPLNLNGGVTDAQGGRVLILGGYYDPLPGGGLAETKAVYEYPGLLRVAFFGDTFPGFTSDNTLQIPSAPVYDGMGGVVFFIRQEATFPNFHWAIVRVAGGSISILVESGVTPVPGVPGATFDVMGQVSGVSASNGVILFYGEGGGRKGVYQLSGGVISTVVDNATTLPPDGRVAPITGPSSVEFANDGTDVVIALHDSFQGGVWKRVNGQWSMVVAQHDPIPGGVGSFYSLGSPSIHQGIVAFRGSRFNPFAPPDQDGLYTDQGGTLAPIVDLGTSFGTDVPKHFDVVHGGRWFDGSRAVFVATDGGFQPTWSALYRATPVPEPDPTAQALAAAALLLGLAAGRIPPS